MLKCRRQIRPVSYLCIFTGYPLLFHHFLDAALPFFVGDADKVDAGGLDAEVDGSYPAAGGFHGGYPLAEDVIDFGLRQIVAFDGHFAVCRIGLYVSISRGGIGSYVPVKAGLSGA